MQRVKANTLYFYLLQSIEDCLEDTPNRIYIKLTLCLELKKSWSWPKNKKKEKLIKDWDRRECTNPFFDWFKNMCEGWKKVGPTRQKPANFFLFYNFLNDIYVFLFLSLTLFIFLSFNPIKLREKSFYHSFLSFSSHAHHHLIRTIDILNKIESRKKEEIKGIIGRKRKEPNLIKHCTYNKITQEETPKRKIIIKLSQTWNLFLPPNNTLRMLQARAITTSSSWIEVWGIWIKNKNFVMPAHTKNKPRFFSPSFYLNQT